jgi:hypothetical protein
MSAAAAETPPSDGGSASPRSDATDLSFAWAAVAPGNDMFSSIRSFFRRGDGAVREVDADIVRMGATERPRTEWAERAEQERETPERRLAEEFAKHVADAEARREAEKRARAEAEEAERREAEERARKEADERARAEAEERERKEAEEHARAEAEERARKEAEEERARAEAEERARREAEERAKREAGERARAEAEERARKETDEKARVEAAERAKREGEEAVRREAVERARAEAEERAARERRERAQREAEDRARRERRRRARQETARADADPGQAKPGPVHPAPPELSVMTGGEAAARARPPSEWVSTCEIAFWRGYRKGAFYARTYLEGEEVAVAESPAFRPIGDEPDRTDEAEAAYEALCEALAEAGWHRVGAGTDWYGGTFRRDFTDAVEPGPE